MVGALDAQNSKERKRNSCPHSHFLLIDMVAFAWEGMWEMISLNRAIAIYLASYTLTHTQRSEKGFVCVRLRDVVVYMHGTMARTKIDRCNQ